MFTITLYTTAIFLSYILVGSYAVKPNCTVIIEKSDCILIEKIHSNESQEYNKRLGYVDDYSENIQLHVGLGAVGKCLNEEFDIIYGEHEVRETYRILQKVENSRVDIQVSAKSAIQNDDLNKILRLFHDDKSNHDVMNLPDFDGRLLLTFSVLYGTMDITKTLILSGADGINNRMSIDGATPFMMAASRNDVESMHFFYKRGSNLDARIIDKKSPFYGYNALFMACQHGASEAIGVLLRSGIDARYVAPDGNDAIDILRNALVNGSSRLTPDTRNRQQELFSQLSALIRERQIILEEEEIYDQVVLDVHDEM